jgi:hypothetical protein
MSKPSPFDELAAGAGIEPYYVDIWGARHALSIDTRRAFLEAMGMSAATEEQTAQSLAALTTKPWRRALEPVTVLYEGHNEWAASVVFEAEPAGPATWQVIAEDGTQYEGNISLGDLPLTEAKTVDGQHLERRLLVLPGSLSLGYHRLEVMGDALPQGSGAATLIMAPQHPVPQCVGACQKIEVALLSTFPQRKQAALNAAAFLAVATDLNQRQRRVRAALFDKI